MSFNEELVRKALDAIKASPQEWDQAAWRCETGMCFAGFVAIAAGARWKDPEDLHGLEVIPPGHKAGERLPDVAEFAAEALGLDLDEGLPLFDANNTIDDLERLIDDYAKHEGAAS